MNSILTTLKNSTPLLSATPLLTQNGFTCTLLNLEPGGETTLPASRPGDDQLLFVVDGDIAVQAGAVTTFINHGDAFLLASEAPGFGQMTVPFVSAREGRRAKVLRVEIPPRLVVTPQIITPGA